MAEDWTQTCYVFGVPVFRGDLDGAARLVVERASMRRSGYVCLCNVHVLMTARRDPQLMGALTDACAVFADGAPVAWLQRRLGAPDARRVAGADLMSRVFELGRREGLRHYLYGSTEDVLRRLVDRLDARYPGAVVGAASPPFGPVNALTVDKSLEAARADVVWCALGAPKQELWMHRFARTFEPAVVVGVGAAFDFLAGTKPRAPGWMRNAGLEWLDRLRNEPRRLALRYLATNSRFIASLPLELFRGRVVRSWE